MAHGKSRLDRRFRGGIYHVAKLGENVETGRGAGRFRASRGQASDYGLHARMERPVVVRDEWRRASRSRPGPLPEGERSKAPFPREGMNDDGTAASTGAETGGRARNFAAG